MVEQQGGIKQPLLGIVATVIVFFIAFGIIVWFGTDTFLTWAGYLAMTLIPFSIIVGLVWQNNYPPPAAKLEQPLKGLYLLLLCFIVGSIVAAWSLKTVGGFVRPPTPMLILFTIMTVIMTFWCVVVWQCWPAAAISSHPAFVGFGTLIVSYILAWILFKTCFDFGFMKDAPFYKTALDPGGGFNAFVSLSFFLTALAVILAWVELDFWPLSSIPPKAPAFGKQPLWGIVTSLLVIIIAIIIQRIFVGAFGMDAFVYAVKVPICIIFGEFIMLLLMQTAPVQTMKQPGKGIILIILTIILAVIMYYLYSWFSFLITGGLPGGPPGYAHELWVATALLSFTFPVIATYTGAFNFWPLTEPKPPAPPEGE